MHRAHPRWTGRFYVIQKFHFFQSFYSFCRRGTLHKTAVLANSVHVKRCFIMPFEKIEVLRMFIPFGGTVWCQKIAWNKCLWDYHFLLRNEVPMIRVSTLSFRHGLALIRIISVFFKVIVASQKIAPIFFVFQEEITFGTCVTLLKEVTASVDGQTHNFGWELYLLKIKKIR